MAVSVTIDHGGVSFAAEIFTIKSTTLGYEDHGILTAFLHCQCGSKGIGVGGYTLDGKPDERGDERVPTAFGLDWITRVIKTVGVDSWEKLPGSRVYVLFSEPNSLGQVAKGIANIDTGEALIFSQLSAKWLGEG